MTFLVFGMQKPHRGWFFLGSFHFSFPEHQQDKESVSGVKQTFERQVLALLSRLASLDEMQRSAFAAGAPGEGEGFGRGVRREHPVWGGGSEGEGVANLCKPSSQQGVHHAGEPRTFHPPSQHGSKTQGLVPKRFSSLSIGLVFAVYSPMYCGGTA